jgi:hypothetical protein
MEWHNKKRYAIINTVSRGFEKIEENAFDCAKEIYEEANILLNELNQLIDKETHIPHPNEVIELKNLTNTIKTFKISIYMKALGC